MNDTCCQDDSWANRHLQDVAPATVLHQLVNVCSGDGGHGEGAICGRGRPQHARHQLLRRHPACNASSQLRTEVACSPE